MGLFSETPSFLGVDIGSSGIKIVELKKEGGKPKLSSYGFTELSGNQLSYNLLNEPKIAAEILNNLCDKSGIKTRSAVSGLPAYSVFSSVLTLSNVNRQDLGSAVQWEAKKFIPLPLEEMILDWNEIKDDSSKEAKQEAKIETKDASEASQNIKVLLTGAPRVLVKKYIDIFKEAKINLLSLETETFALVRCLVGNDKSTVMIVEIGTSTTDISIVARGIPMLNRSLDFGGQTITKAISNNLNVGFDKAEQFKFDLSSFIDVDTTEGLPRIIADAAANIINEVKYSMSLYQSKNNSKVEKIILSGGSAMLMNFASYLSHVLNMNVIIGNPWDRMVYDKDLKPILDEVGARMSVAVGLAMRELE